MSISKQLKAAIKAKDAVLLHVANESGVDYGALYRFMNGTRPNIGIGTVEKLCEYLGLELQPKKKTGKKKRRRMGPPGSPEI
jgi:DNA-binding Xre family transcriptional regulator